MPIRALLFDLDDTLILEHAVTGRALRTVARVVAERAGVDADALADDAAKCAAELWRCSAVAEFGQRFGIWWGEALWGDFAGDRAELRALREFVPDYRRAVWRAALASRGVGELVTVDECAAAYIRARRAGEFVDPEAAPLLDALSRRYRLALVTNGAPDVQREKLSRTTFADVFAAVVISVEAGFGKPDPRLFLSAARALAVGAGECAVVGDSLTRDVAGARAAGMRAVWIDRKLPDGPAARDAPAPDAPAPDATIERLAELPAALDALARLSASPRATP